LRSRLPFAVILVANLLASCAGRPGLSVSIGGEPVPMVLGSVTEGTACSTSHGDAFPQLAPLTTVHLPTPLVMHFAAGQGATAIRGWIYDLEAPSLSGGPIEEFALPGGSGAYEARSILPRRTYNVTVNVRWSFLITQGEETHLFRLRTEP
jgi:hypothetical protein